jgi:hypothetical protein
MLIFLPALLIYLRFVIVIPSSSDFVSEDIILFTNVVLNLMISTTAILEGLGLASYCLGVSTSGVSLYTPVFDKKQEKRDY